MPSVYAEVIRSGQPKDLPEVRYGGDEEIPAGLFSVTAFPLGNASVGVFSEKITERRLAEEELHRSEARFRNIFETANVSIWEEDFSDVKTALDALKAQGVTDFRGYLAAHPEFVQQAVEMVRVIDVNEATLRLLEATSKEELLGG